MNISFDGAQAKRVSFILTTKNHADHLERALPAIQKLIGPDDEFIVVDGGSSDGTLDVIQKFSGMVTHWISEPDVSISHGFNKGVLLASGKYVKQVYDDDEIYPAEVERAIAVLEAHPGVDILVCGGTKREGDRVKVVWLPGGTDYGKSPEDPFRYGACGTGFVMRRSVFAKSGLFPTGWAGDKAFIAQSIAQGAVVKFCRINLFSHPIVAHSIIKSKEETHQKDVLRSVRRYCSRRFYWYMAFVFFLGRYPMFRRIFFSVKRRLNGLFRKSPVAAQNIMWDGGFS